MPLRAAHGVVGFIELEDVPARRTFQPIFHAIGNILVKVFPLKPELAFVAICFLGMVNPLEIKFPGSRRAIQSVLEGTSVPPLPSKPLPPLGPCIPPRLILHETIPL